MVMLLSITPQWEVRQEGRSQETRDDTSDTDLRGEPRRLQVPRLAILHERE